MAATSPAGRLFWMACSSPAAVASRAARSGRVGSAAIRVRTLVANSICSSYSPWSRILPSCTAPG